MITEKDVKEAKTICMAIKIPIELSIGGLKIVATVSTGEILAKINTNTIAQVLCDIRTESAEQARKEAADMACKKCPFFSCGGKDYCWIRAAILGDSAPVSTDSEKLAVAVKALEENLKAFCSLTKDVFGDVVIDGVPRYPLIDELICRTSNALNEIQK